MSDLGLIGYVNPLPKDLTLKGGFQCCEECLISWVGAEAKYSFIKVGKLNRSIEDAISNQERKKFSTIIETIKCINNDGQKGNDNEVLEAQDLHIKHRLTYEEVVEFIQNSEESKYKEMLSDVMLKLFIPSSKTLLICPKQGCDYVGYINPRDKCNDNLSGDKCTYSWAEPSLTPFCSKLKRALCTWNMNITLFNEFQKVVRAQAGPGCGISIIKGPGCQHMNCVQGKKEFCWYCLGDYPGYQHVNVPFCPFRIILKVFIWIWLLTFTINLKLAIQFDGYSDFLLLTGKWFGIWLLANLMLFVVLLFMAFYTCYAENRYQNDPLCGCFKSFAQGAMGLWPIGWVVGWVFAYLHWPLAKTMLWILLWQFVSLVGLAIIVLICVCIFKGILSCLERRRNRKYYEQLYGMNGIHSNDYLDMVNNTSILMDHLLIPQPAFNDNRDSVVIFNQAINFPTEQMDQENFIRVNSIGGMVYPDSFIGEENNDFEERKQELLRDGSTNMIDDIEQDINKTAENKFCIRRKTLADIYMESKTIENVKRNSF